MPKVRYSYSPPGATRRHYLTPEDIEVLLSRLPSELWSRLRTVHFNDRARGFRVAGYVTMGHREIAICAMPVRVSMAKFTDHPSASGGRRGSSPHEFGAVRGQQWPELAVRRYQLYNTFLHEIGHLQLIDPHAKRLQRRFASETKAQEFADYWRAKLWSRPFDHPDPVHNRALARELDLQSPQSL